MVELVEVKEGLARVLVPEFHHERGPRSKKTPVFYNPAMEMNRDISVSVLKAAHRKGMKVLDGLAASGIRGIRFALEVGNIELTMNDWNRSAQELMRKNADINGVEARITGKNLNVLLNEERFDYVDIDPFGTPVQFLDSAPRALRKYGIMAVTATDTAVLCGVYPSVCYRRYMANPEHNWCMHEVGLRILIGNAVRMAARYDLALHPLLSYSADHYFRTYLQVKKGVSVANMALENIGYVEFSENSWKIGGKTGPMWLGPIHDGDFLNKMDIMDFFGTTKRFERMLEMWKGEANAEPFYYELTHVSSELGVSLPPVSKVLERLMEIGYYAVRTHFSPTGAKTDAPVSELFNILSEESNRNLY
jgi:tRNA (guanine26-N2/guanine27-N2)-dimethyltransferase